VKSCNFMWEVGVVRGYEDAQLLKNSFKYYVKGLYFQKKMEGG